MLTRLDFHFLKREHRWIFTLNQKNININIYVLLFIIRKKPSLNDYTSAIIYVDT